MGLIDNGAAQLESNMCEQSNSPKDKKSDPPYDSRMDQERCVSEPMEQKETNESQHIEKILVSAQEKSHETREIGLANGEIPHNEYTNDQEPTLENMRIHLDSKYLEVASQNVLSCLEDIGIPPGTTSINPGCGAQVLLNIEATNDSVLLENGDRGSLQEHPGCGKLVPLKVEVTNVNDSVILENDGTGSSTQQIKRKAKLEGPSSTSWLLRSRSQEKLKAPEPVAVETVNEGSANVEKKKRGRKPKNMQKTTVSEFSRKKNHLRYLLHRINYEKNLIDAYSAEGWRGQSLDKLKPEKELEKAKSRILNYKLKIRALFQSLDQSLTMGKLPESLFDAQGEIDSEDIFCAKCGSKDLTLENDIILCDGACERGFHQFCLEPPLLKTDIPPGDESWLCPGCDCKADCIDVLKDFHETKISIIDSWEKIFPEAAASGEKMDDGFGSSSDDSEDEEYDPDKPDSSEQVEGNKSSPDESSYFSASDDLGASDNNEKYLGLPSDDSEDDDFNPSAPNQDNQVKQDSSSSDFSSDSEDLRALIEDDETATSEDHRKTSESAHHKQKSQGFGEEISYVGRKKRQSLKDELSYLTEASAEPLSRKRHVERLDYKKLNDETYGNSSSDSSDEDFDDATITRKRTKTDHDEVKFSVETVVTASNTNKEDENQTVKKRNSKGTRRNNSDGCASASAKKPTPKRLGEAATQRLLASFNENQYPDRATKENLAKELGLEVRQVGKWFENARWSFNHRPRVESDSAERPPTGTDGTHSHQNTESSEISAQNHIAKLREENLVNDTSGDSSGKQATEKEER
ncbi:pathogenesis-related homeodomain protein-like [Salvia splendens]|uniref:pathogenesis-related homeodomain protein-like n=1 Tax=Salvia splendens TaxID=180675 RepID=UPI00110276C2|nr:pathogenesis-related homeodomain protein-like [Salvia splendens]